MIHFHGTPITPQAERQKLAGKHFCVSFADPRDAEWCLAHGQSTMWDNGRYTAFTQGRQVDDAKLFAWLERLLGGENWGVVPDIIDGSVEDQRRLVATWPFPKVAGAPVWHMALPIDYLLDLAQSWPRICFGSSGQFWQVGSDPWCRRADEAFNALEHAGLLPWLKIHMLRGLALCGDRWPFSSADSVNVARNFKDAATCPERMARLIDMRQCTIRWTLRPTQQDMFNAA